MRLVAFRTGNRRGVGHETADGLFDLGYNSLLDVIADHPDGLVPPSSRTKPVEGAVLEAPLRPGKIICCGVNYRSHLDENPAAVLPDEPFFFSKLPSAVVGPGEPILIPSADITTDYEVELAMVIGRKSKVFVRPTLSTPSSAGRS